VRLDIDFHLGVTGDPLFFVIMFFCSMNTVLRRDLALCGK
jgi:hypothetical protein